MESDGKNTEEIPRRLEDGWHYRPEWRSSIVKRYLGRIDPEIEPIRAIEEEQDSYIRQLYLFRRTGRCMNPEAFAWAYQCDAKNRDTGAASLIKAMTIARIPVKDIALEMRTSSKHVSVFQKLYFDVQPYLDEKSWLATIVFPSRTAAADVAEHRERHWMAAAFLKGKEGLEQVLSRKITLTQGERDELTGQIRATLTARACEFVTSLQLGFIPAGPEDLERLVRVLDASSRQPIPDDREKTMTVFLQGLHTALKEKAHAQEGANEPGLEVYRELKPTGVAPTS